MKQRLQLLPTPRIIDPSILVDETIKTYGYDPRYLKTNSCKTVVKSFSCCGTVKSRILRYAELFHKCLNCSNRDNSNTIEGKRKRSEFMKLRSLDPNYKHPTKGIGHSDTTKQKIRANRKPAVYSDELRKQFSIRFSGAGNPFYGKHHKPESIKRGKDSWAYGVIPAHSIKVWYTSPNGTRVCFRSTWEARTAEHLDVHNIKWEYESKLFPVKYIWEGKLKESTYRSDFWLPETNTFIEVKGYWRTEYKAKFEALKEQYAGINIEVWDRRVLKEKGIYTGR